jgi:hypothetical protein
MPVVLSKYWTTATPNKRLILALIFFGLLTTHSSILSWNDASRMATVQSLVESGSFIIDKSAFVGTGDKVFINGHFYSDKPPAPSLLGAVVYWPLHFIGFELHPRSSVAYYLITLLTVKLLWLLGTLAFFYALRFTGLNEQQRVLASVVLGFGSLYFSWSSTFNNHEIAAALLSIGFCFFLKARHEQSVRRDLFICGLCFSFAGSADVPTAAFYVGFLVYIMFDRSLRRHVVYYLLPTLLTVAPVLIINYDIHHSIMPVNIYQSYFLGWKSDDLSGIRVSDLGFVVTYSFLTLIGPRGFLVYNPFLCVALLGLVLVIRRRRPVYAEGVVIAVASGAITLYYWLMTTNYGGDSYSVRWFVPLLPLLLYFSYPYFAQLHPKNMTSYRVLLGCSLLIASIGAINPWTNKSDIPLVDNALQAVNYVTRPFHAQSHQ